MSRKRKEQPVVEDVLIEDVAAEGKALAHLEGKVLFVPFVAPGDVVDVKVLRSKKSFCEGRAVAIKKPSAKRVESLCPHFGVCGGCKWQMLDYSCQLESKQRQVRDMLERIGEVDCGGMRDICGSEKIFRYRNKLEYTFSTRAWREDFQAGDGQPQAGALGFHIPGLFDKVLNIESCVLQGELSDRIRLFVRDYAVAHGLDFYDIRNHTGFLRNLVIRNTDAGDWMVILVVAESREELLLPLLEALRDTFHQITSLHYIVNPKMNDSYTDLEPHLFAGLPYIEERMAKYGDDGFLRFRINPKSFYQTNSAQAQRLYGFVAEFAGLKPSDTVYDLYVRTYLAETQRTPVHALHLEAAKRVCAKGQAAAYYAIAECLTEDEQAAFRRGRNAHSATVPKHANVRDYRVATGLESMLGHLYLKGEDARIGELMQRILEQLPPSGKETDHDVSKE